MNTTAITGVVLIVVVIIVASVSSGIAPSALWNFPGFIIVVGGTLAATLISFEFRDLRRAFRSLWIVFHRQQNQTRRDAEDMLKVTRTWLHGDMKELSGLLSGIESPFLRIGLEMVTDNILPLPGIVETLRRRIDKLRVKEQAEARIFRSMAGYAPAFGMMGTLFGLAQMFGTLNNNNISSITAGLSVTLLTTIYGVVLSYALFRPFAAKLEHRTETRVIRMQVILEALCLMAQTRSPGILREFSASVEAEFKDELGGAPTKKSPAHT
jgi:chemotaxis protein MotA